MVYTKGASPTRSRRSRTRALRAWWSAAAPSRSGDLLPHRPQDPSGRRPSAARRICRSRHPRGVCLPRRYGRRRVYGFLGRGADFAALHDRMTELQRTEEDANHRIYITGFPWLYASYCSMRVSCITSSVSPSCRCRSCCTPTSAPGRASGFRSSPDPVERLGSRVRRAPGLQPRPARARDPRLLTARALSHSVQSMDRYHEEFYRLGDKHQAIVVSYSHLFAPAIASIVTDGIGLLVVAVAPIRWCRKSRSSRASG